MKMAKASKEEWQKLMDFANEYEELTGAFKFSPSDADLGKLLKKHNPEFFRTVFGYATLVDMVCDPKDNCLALKPEISEILEKAGYELKSGGFDY